MRKVLYLGLLIGLSLNMACSDWLDATSETQVEADDLLSNEDGFKDAMIGVYINMGEEDGYGMNYTWYANELAAFPYATQLGDDYTIWQNHRYTTTLAYSYFEEMWGRSYNIIANVNKILSSLEENRSNLSELSYNLMKGEMLGVRAYVHFDLLRMFGLSHWNGENADKYTVPYVTDFSLEQTEQRTYAETATLLFDDINEALKCLADDPIIGSHDESYYADINLDGFWNDRTKRMNYYAVKALQARLYMWMKDYTEAEKAANAVISSNAFPWAQLSVVSLGHDYAFATEQIFALNNINLSNLSDTYFAINQGTSFSLSAEVREEYFDNTTTDYRYLYQFQSGTESEYVNLRYLMKYSNPQVNLGEEFEERDYYSNKMPIIHLGEMYLIVAECRYRNGGDALSVLNTLRTARSASVLETMPADFYSELIREYRRELLGEGQLFFVYKRLNRASIPGTDADMIGEKAYTFPLTVSETDAAQRENNR